MSYGVKYMLGNNHEARGKTVGTLGHLCRRTSRFARVLAYLVVGGGLLLILGAAVVSAADSGGETGKAADNVARYKNSHEAVPGELPRCLPADGYVDVSEGSGGSTGAFKAVAEAAETLAGYSGNGQWRAVLVVLVPGISTKGDHSLPRLHGRLPVHPSPMGSAGLVGDGTGGRRTQAQGRHVDTGYPVNRMGARVLHEVRAEVDPERDPA